LASFASQPAKAATDASRLPAGAATIAFPALPAIRASVTLPANDGGGNAILRLDAHERPTDDLPAALRLAVRKPGARSIAFLRVTLSRDVRFGFGTVAYRFELPPHVVDDDTDFFAAACDERACRSPYVLGPMRHDGAALAFSTRGLPIHFRFTARGEHPYVMALYRLPARRRRLG
jgi:hypothetical protein